jgi:aminomethyltransferase
MKTVLFEEHQNLNGRIVDFAGWELPVMYTSIVDEHTATRKKAGLFDISHMGEITLKGTGAADLLKKVIPTSLEKLESGKSMYSCFCNENGGVVDDIFVFMVEQDEYYLVVNAATIEKDINWLKKHNTHGVEIIDHSSETAKIDLQGPESYNIIQKMFPDHNLKDLTRFHFRYIDYKNTKMMLSVTGYTGEHGYELYINNNKAVELWSELLEKGKEFGLKPVGLGARDSLRLEACYSLYGHEISDTINPIEADLRWLTSSKENYIGKEIIDNAKQNGTDKTLVTFELTEKGIPRENYRVEKQGKDIGYCTSAGFSPTYQKGIGMALVESGNLKLNDEFEIVIRNKRVKAKVVKRPIYPYNNISI